MLPLFCLTPWVCIFTSSIDASGNYIAFHKHSPPLFLAHFIYTIYIERQKKRWAKKERKLPESINKTWNEHLIQWNWYTMKRNETFLERQKEKGDYGIRHLQQDESSHFHTQSRKQSLFHATNEQIWCVPRIRKWNALFDLNFDVCNAQSNPVIHTFIFMLLWTFCFKETN